MKEIIVNDKMQKEYSYFLSEKEGENFDARGKNGEYCVVKIDATHL